MFLTLLDWNFVSCHLPRHIQHSVCSTLGHSAMEAVLRLLEIAYRVFSLGFFFTLLLFDNLAYTTYIFPERYSDGEYVEHPKSTLTQGVRFLE